MCEEGDTTTESVRKNVTPFKNQNSICRSSFPIVQPLLTSPPNDLFLTHPNNLETKTFVKTCLPLRFGIDNFIKTFKLTTANKTFLCPTDFNASGPCNIVRTRYMSLNFGKFLHHRELHSICSFKEIATNYDKGVNFILSSENLQRKINKYGVVVSILILTMCIYSCLKVVL